MKYGCIGEKLKHSFSKEIHNALADYEYEIREIPRDCLDTFMEEKDFLGINVTIPYKESVIPHLSEIDEHAREIGAVNTIVNRGGKLFGYNTDFRGMTSEIHHAKIAVRGMKVAVLGTGGTSKTARCVSRALGAREVLVVSRNPKENEISYDELYEKHPDTQIIINTTPLGMYPNNYTKAVELSRFCSLVGVIDAVYNPLRTPLVREAMALGIPAEGGLYMLVSQAIVASEIFLSNSYCESECERVYKKILNDKENIILIGMPASGKSTVSAILAKRLGRERYDTDDMIVERCGCEITEIFAKRGEGYFRDLESEAIKEVSARSGAIIATGGGAILRKENVDALRQNGKIFFIDRPLEALVPTESRPLSSDRESIEKRYRERYELYRAAADAIIDADCEADDVAEKILEAFQA